MASDLSVRVAHVDTTGRRRCNVDRCIVRVLYTTSSTNDFHLVLLFNTGSERFIISPNAHALHSCATARDIQCTLSRSHFLIDSHQIGHRGNTPKLRTSSLGSISHHPFLYFPPKTPIVGQTQLHVSGWLPEEHDHSKVKGAT